MDALKDESIKSNNIWKAAGKPRHGPIFIERIKARNEYRKMIKECQKNEQTSYTNELHEALIAKDGIGFWKCWQSKFTSYTNCDEVDGCIDPNTVANKFREYFSSIYSPNNKSTAELMHQNYANKRLLYVGDPMNNENAFSTEVVSKIIDNLKRGKAAGLDGLSAEHLIFCCPIISCILAKLFNLMLISNYVPSIFGNSYTVPLPKPKNIRGKSLSCNDFRGIAISCIISKIFEYSILECFEKYLESGANQFGFKKNLGCTHAIFALRKISDRFTQGGSTVNVCSLDLSKAFDKVNHHGLLIKLMNRHVPKSLILLLEFWLDNCWSCIKWKEIYSEPFKLNYGVRQGSVLSPFFSLSI